MRDDEKDKWIGSDEFWEYSTERPAQRRAGESGLKLTEVPGEAAFYGPKIDLQDARTRSAAPGSCRPCSSTSTCPERFELEYTDRDGTQKRPIMIHRALFGSIERFFAILLEHYAGAFPVWLSPVQVVGIPVADEYADYLGDVISRLDGRRRARRARPLRRPDAEEDPHPHHPARCRSCSSRASRTAPAGTVSFRFRDGTQHNGVPIDDAIDRIRGADRDRTRWSTRQARRTLA